MYYPENEVKNIMAEINKISLEKSFFQTITPIEISTVTPSRKETLFEKTRENHTNIYFVSSGKCIFSFAQETYRSGTSGMCVCPPETEVNVIPDESGKVQIIKLSLLCDNSFFAEKLPRFSEYRFNTFFELQKCVSFTYYPAEYAQSKVFEILVNTNRRPEITKGEKSYVDKVCDYIEESYMNPVSVEKISAYVSLNRQYLTRLFKKHKGVSIQQYLIATRMEKSLDLLKKGYTINEISTLVGYTDQFTFSRGFSKYFGKSPNEYKKTFLSH